LGQHLNVSADTDTKNTILTILRHVKYTAKHMEKLANAKCLTIFQSVSLKLAHKTLNVCVSTPARSMTLMGRGGATEAKTVGITARVFKAATTVVVV
jgi:hypothetical protein